MKHFSDLRIRSKKAFAYYFSLILVVVFVLLLLFSAYVFYLSGRNFREKQRLSDLGILNQSIEKLDSSFSMISHIAATAATNREIINTCIVPSLTNRQRNFNVLTTLESIVDKNEYVKRAWLYEYTKGCLFSSEGDITTLSGYSRSSTIMHCLNDIYSVTIDEENNRYCSSLIQDGQKLYYTYDFVYSSKGPLCSLILELNKDVLFADYIDRRILTDYDITIHGNRTYPIYSTLKDVKDENFSHALISSGSDYTKWITRLYPRSTSKFSIPLPENGFLPFFMGLLGVSFFMTYFITSKAYSPIEKLTKLVNGESASEPVISAHQNEFDYLEQAFQGLLSNRQVTREFLDKTRPDLESRLFAGLITESVSYTTEELKSQLRTMQSPFAVEEKYQVILLHLKDIRADDVVSMHIYRNHLMQLALQQFQPEWGLLRCLSVNDQECVLVIQYLPESSSAQIKKIVKTFRASLIKETERSSIHIVFAEGKLYYNLSEISTSYHDALEEIHYELYYQKEESSGSVESSGETSSDYYDAFLKRIETVAGKGDMVLSADLVGQFESQLFAAGLPLGETRTYCQKLLDTLVEKLLLYQSRDEEKGSSYFQTLYQKLEKAEDSSSLRSAVEEAAQQLLDDITNESQKRQNRLIALAREYIAANYSNSSLSINEIAQDVGCTPSYLSNLFTKYTGENLVTCLNGYRIQVAKELLLNSQMKISDIGFKVGFNTVQNFNRVFKSMVNMTPNEFRKTGQKMNVQ